jgi:hypothetical protein
MILIDHRKAINISLVDITSKTNNGRFNPIRLPRVIFLAVLEVFVLRDTVRSEEVKLDMVESLAICTISSHDSVQSAVRIKDFLIRSFVSTHTNLRSILKLSRHESDC